MTTVLVGLDSVDWTRLRTSDPRRDARDVPRLLRNLEAAADPGPFAWSGELAGLVVHDHSGCLVQSAEFVIPFLIALCAAERAGVAPAAVSLLIDLTAEPFITEIEAGNTDMRARTWAAILAGRESYYALLGSAEPGARADALELLSILEHGSPRFQRAMADLEKAEDHSLVLERIRDLAAHPGLDRRTPEPPD
ncbi:hypothetical protein R8Z50_24145 [Longispora sp. K20-0274]|uniref:hypothetical protein n=1 Tax=Longispora sp. K20-0274 TaxID=3088255 RepID=UPI00399B4F47